MRNTPVANVVEPQNRIRDSANAAGTLMSIVVATTIMETTAELRKYVRNCEDDSSST